MPATSGSGSTIYLAVDVAVEIVDGLHRKLPILILQVARALDAKW